MVLLLVTLGITAGAAASEVSAGSAENRGLSPITLFTVASSPSWFDSLTTNGSGNAPSPMPLPIPLGGSLGLAFLGRLRSSRYGGMNIEGVLPYAPTTHYEAAANATFVSLNDVGRVPPADATQQTAGGTRPTLDGWNTQGSVDVADGVATLNEISTSQTRLSQVFMLGEQ